MFTKRHEQELAEIKAATIELGQRLEEVLTELEGIKQAQSQRAPGYQGAKGGKQGAEGGKRKANRLRTKSPGLKAAGEKKSRRRQRLAAGGGTRPNAGSQRGVSAPASPEDPAGGSAPKRSRKGKHKQRRSDVPQSAGSDENPRPEEQQAGEESRRGGP